jgi:hypothetical protein
MTLLVSSCRELEHTEGVALSLNVPVQTFLEAKAAKGSLKNAIVDFPTIELYDRAGLLIYRSSNAVDNAALVRSLPGALKNLTQIPNQPQLSRVLDTLPGLVNADKLALLNSRRPTLIDYSLEECDACRVQEEALGPETVRSLESRGLNLLAIHVSRPWPEAGQSH